MTGKSTSGGADFLSAIVCLLKPRVLGARLFERFQLRVRRLPRLEHTSVCLARSRSVVRQCFRAAKTELRERIQHRRRYFSLMVDDRLELAGGGLAVLQLKVR